MEEAGKTLSRVREEKKKEEDGKGRAKRGKDALGSLAAR